MASIHDYDLPAPKPWDRFDEGEQPGTHGPQHIVSLVAENQGGGVVGEFLFQMQVPFVPPDTTQPIGPDRIIRLLVAAELDGQGWKNWKYWHYIDQSRSVLGITLHCFGDVKLFRPMELILCQFHLPVGWFSSTLRPTTYECPYSLVYPPDVKEEGVLRLGLFELVEGCY